MEFDNIRLGDSIYSLRYGTGTVIEVLPPESSTYSVRAVFPDDPLYSHGIFITRCGRELIRDAKPTFFRNKPIITTPPKPLPDLPVDAKVLVWDCFNELEVPAYFHSFTDQGHIRVWRGGRTSFTNRGRSDATATYRHFRIPTEEE